MKKLFLFTLTLMVGVMGGKIQADEVTVAGVRYDVNNVAKTAKVLANSYSGDLYIPDVINDDIAVDEIAADALHNCSDLRSVRFSANIHRLEGNIFTGCSSLNSIVIPADSMGSNELTLVGEPGSFPFEELSDQLQTLCLSKDIKHVNKNTNEEVTDYSAFITMTALYTLVIGQRVTTIGDYAFKNGRIRSIIVHAQIPPVCGDSCFVDSRKSVNVGYTLRSILYLPYGAYSAYDAADVWKEIPNKIQAWQEMPVPTEPATLDYDGAIPMFENEVDPQSRYVLSGGARLIKASGTIVQQVALDARVDTGLISLMETGMNMEDLAYPFSGVTLKVPAGKGYLNVDALQEAYHWISVAIEGYDTLFFKAPTRDTIKVEFDVKRDSKVFIFSSMPYNDWIGAPVRRIQEATGGLVRLFGVEWHVDQPQAIENVSATTGRSRKIFRDGQVFILRDDKIYTLTGQEITL